MAIANRNLEPGTKLVARYKKQEYSCEVVAGDEGKLRYRLPDGREFRSPSSAGTAITGMACNGWAFWSLAAGSAAEDESYEWAEDAAKVAGGEDAEAPECTVGTLGVDKPQFRRVPNQRGVPDGQVRLYCTACKKSFTASSDTYADSCPDGHKPGESIEEKAGS